MKAKWKWLMAASVAVVTLGGVMALPFFIDEAPPEDADLLPRRAEVPLEENGFSAFDVRLDEVHLPARADPEGGGGEGDEEANGGSPGALELALGQRWDPEIVRETLERNADVLLKLEECLAGPRLQLPMTEDYEIPPGSGRPWLPAANLLVMRARSHMEEGRHQDTVLDLEKTIRLGRLVQAGGGLLFHFMIGRSIESLGLRALKDLAQSPGVDPVLLAPIAREVAAFSGIEAARNTLKIEYAIFSSDIDRILSDPALSAYLWEMPSIWHDPLFLKPNASRRLFAEKLRIVARNLELPVLERTDLRLEALQVGFIRRWIPRPNALGRSAVQALLQGMERSIASTADVDLDRAFTATLIALQCWRARHGALPPTLDTLVPEYLDAVPRDPYDGKPLRYSAEKRILYSVGRDGIDSGGSKDADDEAALGDGMEPTLRLQ